jgi:aminoglycoside phosphotransferase (APT) family kinase protein
MIDVDGATSFLVDRGLVDTSAIIDGELCIRSQARRNRNLKVEGPGGAGYLIKQPDDPRHGGLATLRRELAFHRFCRTEPTVERVTRFIPRLVDADHDKGLLVFALVPDAGTFDSVLYTENSRQRAIASGRRLGSHLATLHQCFGSQPPRNDRRLAEFPDHLPWALRLHKPAPALLAILSAANYQTVRILQTQDGLAKRLDHLAHECRPDTVIHGDMKFNNVLIQPGPHPPTSAPAQVWIVDWEMVQLGDPAWDLAGLLQDFLVRWIGSMPISGELSSDERIARASLPLAGLRDTIRSLWDGYRRTADLTFHDGDRFLQRAVSLSAARLIQSAYESMCQAQRLEGLTVLLLQTAANILAQPRRAQVQLYGIPWRDALS